MATHDPLHAPEDFLQQRRALHAVLESSVFKKSSRLAPLLQYICNKYFSGETKDVKEYSIAVDVFRRPETFDPATDSIVRVEIYRLRKKLREFYDNEGVDQALEIVIATGQYIPQFVPRPVSPSLAELASLDGVQADAGLLDATAEESTDEAHSQAAHNGSLGFSEKQRSQEKIELPKSEATGRPAARGWKLWLFAGILVAILGLAMSGMRIWDRMHTGGAKNAGSSASWNFRNFARMQSTAATGWPLNTSQTSLRIRCGYAKPVFRDEEGNLWSGDHFFQGGSATEIPSQHIAGTRDSQLYLTYRAGTFSYKIPLKPGTYEMRLHFSETTYGPATTLGGGENSRVFDVQMNGKPLLTRFDIDADAGESTADIRVFKDIHPAADGFLHLDFNAVIGLPMINAIEIIPGIPNRLHTIRMVAQNNFFVDRAGNLWSPDNYFTGGQLAADNTTVSGTDEPGLYAGERYGNFRYALPADQGKYTLRLYFSEKYWGSGSAPKGNVIGSRVFDVRCNGISLLRNLDIAKEVGPGRALVESFSGLRPSAQGKIVVSFVPDKNYALVDAVELQEEPQ